MSEERFQSVRRAATTGGLPVAPSMGPGLDEVRAPRETPTISGRVLAMSGLAVGLAIGAGVVAQVLTTLIGLITNLCFHGRLSTAFVSPAGHHLGGFVVLVPVVGGVVVGLMARYGSKAIRGHGIPEAMEQVLTNESRIAPRMTFLKPLSSAVAIGTGGPFGAEGPIIATGGALGSLIGQLLRVTADERKTLLASGAAAGMAATFGTPVAAVLLAVELLLFELRARSLVPVALAACTATCVRAALVGPQPVFPMPAIETPGGAALAAYVVLGGLMGGLGVVITRLVYGLEDAFARLPLHWMWWPALGGLAVGIVGVAAPRTMGVGYDVIEQVLSGELAGRVVVAFVVMKFLSWWVSLSSGTSGGTLAPLFMIGGGVGSALVGSVADAAPALGLDARVGALVGMASLFAGASRALLASVVFAFETTRQPLGLLPLLGACAASYLVSARLMRTSLMTEKIARRGVRVPAEYSHDALDRVVVGERMTRDVVTLPASRPLAEVRAWFSSSDPGARHHGFPVLDDDGAVLGLVTWRDVLEAGDRSVPLREVVKRPPAVCFEAHSLREAADHMVGERVGRLIVVTPDSPRRLVGIITRKDLLEAHRRRLEEAQELRRTLELREILGPKAAASAPE